MAGRFRRDHSPIYHDHAIASAGSHLLAMDAEGSLSSVTKVFLLFTLRERAVFSDVELESLIRKDIPRITNELPATVTILMILAILMNICFAR
jgi:hypothetical protein